MDADLQMDPQAEADLAEPQQQRELPCNHVSKFRPEWWNERRRRDYYVDADGLVHIRMGSPTALALEKSLREYARRLALEICPAEGSA